MLTDSRECATGPAVDTASPLPVMRFLHQLLSECSAHILPIRPNSIATPSPTTPSAPTISSVQPALERKRSLRANKEANRSLASTADTAGLKCAPETAPNMRINPTSAPAVANAVFAATGRRVRDLPITPAKLAQAAES